MYTVDLVSGGILDVMANTIPPASVDATNANADLIGGEQIYGYQKLVIPFQEYRFYFYTEKGAREVYDYICQMQNRQVGEDLLLWKQMRISDGA